MTYPQSPTPLAPPYPLFDIGGWLRSIWGLFRSCFQTQGLVNCFYYRQDSEPPLHLLAGSFSSFSQNLHWWCDHSVSGLHPNFQSGNQFCRRCLIDEIFEPRIFLLLLFFIAFDGGDDDHVDDCTILLFLSSFCSQIGNVSIIWKWSFYPFPVLETPIPEPLKVVPAHRASWGL